ncbi:hypothetical protein F4779DRAFT_70091 [Xylariaceae sp. FL0662B]|nr:hypothetical protein F4779DRAFT_70091 [Xylariaceae sp. FL0662B]
MAARQRRNGQNKEQTPKGAPETAYLTPSSESEGNRGQTGVIQGLTAIQTGPSGGSGPNARPGWNSDYTLYVPRIPVHPERPFAEKLKRQLFGDPDVKWGPALPFMRQAEESDRRPWTIENVSRRVRLAEDRERVEAALNQDGQDGPDRPKSSRDPGVTKPEYRDDRPFPMNMSGDLRRDARPSRIDFAEWMGIEQHFGDYDDDFYKTHYDNLYNKTVDFATRWFDCGVDLEPVFGDRVWDLPLTEQFKQYARLVAHEDKLRGGWPAILNHPRPRRWLVVGILAQIMEKKIFNELLFGATDAFKEDLDRLDTRFIEREGYSRKFARTGLVELALARRFVPTDFWPEVDQLAVQTAMIFLPLMNVFKECRAQAELEYWHWADMFLQELHTILAYAGFIQVCMARSESIFHFLSATPGARMDYALEHQSDMPMYRDSKELSEEIETEWRQQVDQFLERGDVAAIDRNNADQDKAPMPRDEDERRRIEHGRIRGARVKFAVFPKVTRYKPHNKGMGMPDDAAYGPGIMELTEDDTEGQKIIDISQCMVVYYQGLMYPPVSTDDGLPLDIHLERFPKKPEGLVVEYGKLLWEFYSTSVIVCAIVSGLLLSWAGLLYYCAGSEGVSQVHNPYIGVFGYNTVLLSFTPTALIIAAVSHVIRPFVSAGFFAPFVNYVKELMEVMYVQTRQSETAWGQLGWFALFFPKLFGIVSWAVEVISKYVWGLLP